MSHLFMGVEEGNAPKCACRWQGKPRDSYEAACVAHAVHAVQEVLPQISMEDLQGLDEAILREHIDRVAAGSVA